VTYLVYILAILSVLIPSSLFLLPRLNAEYITRWMMGSHSWMTAFSFTATASFMGWLASSWKRLALKSYAITEISFGCVLSFNVILYIAPRFEFSKLVALGSAVYVIARGFSNLADAIAQKARIIPRRRATYRDF
jgi:hypothetical protein